MAQRLWISGVVEAGAEPQNKHYRHPSRRTAIIMADVDLRTAVVSTVVVNIVASGMDWPSCCSIVELQAGAVEERWEAR